jgi:lipoprotein-anchoring transpeptidase ErfK/SrfK
LDRTLRKKTLITVAASLAALLILAGAVVAYDNSKQDQIAKGIRVGGIDVGGLTKAEASAKLRRQILDGLRRPVVVDHGTRAWTLTAKQARITTNLDATVADALARSRGGGIIGRTWRGITGGTVDASITPQVAFSDKAVVHLLDRVRAKIDRRPVDAKVDISGTGVARVPSQEGLAVDATSLHRAIKAALVSPTAQRRFAARTEHVRPKVSTPDLEHKYGTVLIVNRKAFKLTLYKALKPVKTYGIAVGKVGLETPAGLYSIQNKAVDPAWHVPDSDWAGKLAGKVIPGDDPTNPIKSRWMGIYDGAGIHGTSDDSSIGSAASHGCIRMHVPEVKELYDRVPVGTPVYIA